LTAAASSAVFTRFFRECIQPTAEFRFTGMTHRATQPFTDGMFDSDENAIVDFKILEFTEHHLVV